MRRLFVFLLLAVMAFTFLCPKALGEDKQFSAKGFVRNWWRALYPVPDGEKIQFYSSILTWFLRWTRGGGLE